ncbi:hypothetical protein ACRALDRAFT_207106 [Sodiomyces alcalophilus JCM 7366]|uniref:uncharacterized protein n=1 Tax=Sodiomyces alcalophilus JCM 7366 TaxID=591952 RepID=UPI0039B3A827
MSSALGGALETRRPNGGMGRLVRRFKLIASAEAKPAAFPTTHKAHSPSFPRNVPNAVQRYAVRNTKQNNQPTDTDTWAPFVTRPGLLCRFALDCLIVDPWSGHPVKYIQGTSMADIGPKLNTKPWEFNSFECTPYGLRTKYVHYNVQHTYKHVLYIPAVPDGSLITGTRYFGLPVDDNTNFLPAECGRSKHQTIPIIHTYISVLGA